MDIDQFRAQAEREDGHWWHRGKREILRRLARRALPPSPDRLVVDVGCGPGGNAAALAGEYDCAGIDASPEAVAFARARFPGVRFFLGRAPEDLGPLAERADLFILADVLEHVVDDRGMLRRIVSAAKPGAHVLITVPAGMDLWSGHDESLGHYRRYDRRGLAALWRDLPVTERLLSHYNARLYPAARAARALGRRLGLSWGQAGTDVGPVPGPLNRLLAAVFAGEAGRLAAAVDGGAPGYARGVSLMALLRRER